MANLVCSLITKETPTATTHREISKNNHEYLREALIKLCEQVSDVLLVWVSLRRIFELTSCIFQTETKITIQFLIFKINVF